MTPKYPFGFIRNAATASFATLLLSGCLMGDNDPKTLDDVSLDVRLSGSVGDGPVVGAQMRIVQNDGSELTTFVSDSNASYNITVNARERFYPLTIEANGGTDLVTNLAPEFEMLGAVPQPRNQGVANVNPHSTIAVLLAEELAGDFTATSLSNAQSIVVSELSAGLDSLASSGVMTTYIDENNIAEIVRASETLAETVRRSRDILNGAGFTTNADIVVAAIASDLTDQVLNGRGGASADARLGAIATIVYAQVLMEAMANQIHVNGVNARSAMTNAINQVSVRTPTTGLDDLRVTSEMLRRARIGIAAAVALDNDASVTDLHATVSGLQAGMDADLVRTLLPQDYRSMLDNALVILAGADAGTIDAVNDIASGNGDIDPGNRAPTITGTPATSVEVASAYSFTPNAMDADGDSLTFSISNIPSWGTFNTSSGQLSGSPSANDVGTYQDIVIAVSDGQVSVSLPAFSITVFQGNAAPSISGTPPATVIAGQSYVFAPSASDPNGDTLTFSISNQPSWATFNSSTGRLTGAPFESDVGRYAGIVITVSDGVATASLAPFAITVQSALPPPNNPPTITGNPPAQITANSPFSFTPTANDPDGDTLSFTIANQPSWASFNTTTGTLSGTPADGDVGTYSAIRITVSDGAATANLEFSITVNAVSLGSVVLNWTAPTLNEDGSTLTDLAGYKIYSGTTPGVYSLIATIDNPSVMTYQVDNLAPGTYYFVATAVDAGGEESRYSGMATETVP